VGRLAANKGNGICISTNVPWAGSPQPIDVCLVPPPASGTPTPFVNTANLDDTVEVAENVYINGKRVVVLKSEIPFSAGAPPTAISGVSSPPPANNKCTFVTASATVFVEGSAIERHRDTTLQNHGNCSGGVKLSDAFSLDESGISINATDPEREAIIRNLEELYEQPVGRELLDSIRASNQATGNGIRIQSTTGGNQVLSGSFNWTNATNGTGDSSTVGFNPHSTQIGGEPRPPAVGLGHELIHSYHIQNGTLATGTSVGASSGVSTGNWEQQAIGLGPYSSDRLTDNQLRNERGLGNRRSHVTPDENDFPYSPDDGTRAAQAWATGTGGVRLVYAGG
jgi:hypothetical protein